MQRLENAQVCMSPEMGEQRQRFSFRLPWSVPSAPARRSTTETNSPSRATSANNQPTPNPTTTAQRSASRSSGLSQTQKPKAPSTLKKTDPEPITTERPNAPTQTDDETQNPALTSTLNQPSGGSQSPPKTTPQPIIPADQTSPLRDPQKVVEVNSPLQDQALPKTKFQPSSPSPQGLRSRTSSQTASQSRAGAQSQATSKSPLPSNASPQFRSPSQPPLPSRGSIKSKNASQSPIVSHPKSPQSETASLPSSPARSQNKTTPPAAHHPQSPPSLPTQLPAQIPKTKQSTAGEPTQTLSSPKIINTIENDLPPTTTTSKPPLSISETHKQALSQPQPQETHADKDITDNIISKAPIEETINPIATAPLPSQHSNPVPTIPTPVAANDMPDKEIMMGYEATGYKEVLNSNTPILYGKQSKTMASHQSDKNMAGAYRQKPVVSNREGISMQREIKNDISKLTHKMAMEQGKPVSVITLVGENKGAAMQLGSEREGTVHIHRGYKLNPGESAEATTNGEESSKPKRPKEANSKEDQMTKAYMNNNSQGINNSIVFHSSITERNPGVHLSLTHDPTDPDKANQVEAHKAETSILPPQKLTYDPTIRRRCLRGLFMESSDSDPGNPEKPRRHGCRCSYPGMNKDKDRELL